MSKSGWCPCGPGDKGADGESSALGVLGSGCSPSADLCTAADALRLDVRGVEAVSIFL